MKKLLILITTIFILHILAISTASANIEETPSLLSEAAIMIEVDSGAVLYEKNADSEMYPASVTKIATAIYTIENGDLIDIVTVSNRARNVDGTRVYLEEGEQVTLKKLLQGLLINSGNDAGVAIAEHMSGSVEQFASDLNEYLKLNIGVENTNFTNPHGLFDPNHLTTARDLALITQYAMKNEQFKEIFGTKELVWNGQSWSTTLHNHHRMLIGEFPYEGISGGKNGYVSESGFTLVTTAERENLNVITVTLKTNLETGTYKDTIALLDFGFEHFKTSSIAKGTTFEVNGKEFTTSEALTYTQMVNDQIKSTVTDEGKLEIVNQDHEVVAAFQLEEIVDEKETTLAAINSVADEVMSEPITKHQVSLYAVLALVIAGGIAGIIYRQMKRI